MVKYYFRSLKSKKLKELGNYKPGCFVVVTEATQRDIQLVSKIAKLQVEDVDDIFDKQEVPRIEYLPSAALIYLRSPRYVQPTLFTDSLLLVVTAKSLIAISANKQNIIADFPEQHPQIPTTQHAKFLVLLLLEISRTFTAEIKKIQRQVGQELTNLDDPHQKDITALIQNEIILNQYLTALVPMQMIYRSVLTGTHIRLYAEDEDLFEDVLITINQSIDVCKTNIKMINSLRDSFQILFTNKLNHTMKVLTSFTILMTIPTIISSIYGMNIILPLAEHAHAFSILLIISAGLIGILWYFFHKKNWF